jgi:hypothetical protein
LAGDVRVPAARTVHAALDRHGPIKRTGMVENMPWIPNALFTKLVKTGQP